MHFLLTFLIDFFNLWHQRSTGRRRSSLKTETIRATGQKEKFPSYVQDQLTTEVLGEIPLGKFRQAGEEHNETLGFNQPLEEEQALVEKARSGDQEAFGELVRRHRSNACSWANSLMQDQFLAEDIVQDALIRAFLHLHQLMDSRRFRPWLKQIIHNQARMKLRRGGVYAKETPFTGFVETGKTGGNDDGGSDIDQILYHLSKTNVQRSKDDNDPEKHLLRQETITTIMQMLDMLSPKEREIFEAHFFQQCDPKEIAVMMQTTPANVYNILSRARKKVRRERIRLHLRNHLTERGLKKKILPVPQVF